MMIFTEKQAVSQGLLDLANEIVRLDEVPGR